MPNLVNRILVDQLKTEFESMGSCLVVSFDKLTVEQANDIRSKWREAGLAYHVVKNRLALKAFESMKLDLSEAFRGKCGVIIAPEEAAISAARIAGETFKKIKDPPIVVTGGVIEGEVITGAAAAGIGDMPDKTTVRGQIAGCILGVARAVATCIESAGPGGVARVLQARIDDAGDGE
ncbi:MAG: 50S ribosomal protein L10 [Planctomycetota bacterium]